MVSLPLNPESSEQNSSVLRILRAAWEISPAGIVVTDPSGLIQYANPAFTSLNGYTDGEVAGQTPRILKSGFHGPEFYADLWGTISSGRVWTGRIQNRRNDGSLYWADTTISPICDEGGKILHYIALKQNVTACEQAEESRRASDQLLADVVSNNLDGILILDQNQKIVMANPSASALFHKPVADLLNTEFGSFATGSPFELEVVHGDTFSLLELWGVDTVWQGAPAQLAIVRDMTERRRTEAALHLTQFAIDHMADPAYWITEDSRIAYANEAACQALGYSKEELVGLFVADISRPAREENYWTPHWAELKRVGSLFFEGEHRTKDGRNFPVEISANYMTFAGMEYNCAFARDITDRKQAEDELRKSEARLREANATKDKFFSIIAHDLKNPFHAIQGFSEILREQMKNKDYEGIEEYAEIILQSSRRAVSLTANLLEWARSQTGKMEFSPEPIDIVAIINETVELAGDQALKKAVTISRQLPHQAIALADRTMIGTVLRNLISNAIKYTRPGGDIRLALERAGSEWKTTVSDNGVGMTRESVEKLFRIGESSSTSGTQNETGTGLGLILCREFVELHSGKIRAESELGQGSRFCFTIPVPQAFPTPSSP